MPQKSRTINYEDLYIRAIGSELPIHDNTRSDQSHCIEVRDSHCRGMFEAPMLLGCSFG